MIKRCWILFFLFLAFRLEGQKPLSVETVCSGALLPVKSVAVEWTPDGNGYSRIEYNSALHANEIVAYDAATGRRTVQAPAGWLSSDGKPLNIWSYRWSRDTRKMLLFHNARRVWRYPTRGDYTVLDMTTGEHYPLGRNLPKGSLMFAKFSPDSRKVAYVCRNNLYTEDLQTKETTQLTFDGNDRIINGTFDWMYEEEFDCRDGFRWSPDSRNIAYWQSDTDGTGVFRLINNVDSIYSSILPLPYPKVGTTLPAVKVGIVAASGGATQWIDIPGDARNHYLPRMDYIPESDDLIVHQFNRRQNVNHLWTVHEGKASLLFTEKDEAWVDVNDNNRWLDGDSFTWMSERDGWRHLYRVGRNGKDVRCLTPGAFDVVEIAGIDAEKGFVYFIATEENFTQRYLYRASLNGKAKVQKIDPAGQTGKHSYRFSPTGKWAIHSFQNTVTPPVYSLVRFPENTTVSLLEDNAETKRKYDSLHLPEKEFIRLDAGAAILDAWMLKPADFDSTKKYPVIADVYGEPASSTVQDQWAGGSLWHQYLAQEGYIVVSIDNRGTNVPRGREWRKCIYRKTGILNTDDQAAAMRKMLEQYPFLDAGRVGVTGWSGGGSTTLNCMFRFPELYKTGIAVASVSDRRLYDAAYEERYMGVPDSSYRDYVQASAVSYAKHLKGNLLLIHGTGDDNVHYQNCERLINELIRHKKMFSLLTYPMRSHGIFEGENTTLHLRLSMEKFWKEYLPAGGK